MHSKAAEAADHVCGDTYAEIYCTYFHYNASCRAATDGYIEKYPWFCHSCDKKPMKRSQRQSFFFERRAARV